MRSILLGVCVLGLVVGCGGNPEVADNGGLGTTGTEGGAAGAPGNDHGPGIDVNVGEGGAADMPDSVCGNGVLESGELCDDKNTKDGDGCSADCLTQDEHYDCSKPGEPCVDLVVCGDGLLEDTEACDDGNLVDGDGCAADCSAVEGGFVCPRPGKDCVALPDCGNGERERGEACDDGNIDDNDGCSSTCQLEAGFFCAPGMPCKPLKCGDGVRTPDEQCDDGQNPPQNGDGCSTTCQVEPGFRCGVGGCAAVCGDGVLRGSETCDDHNRVSGDGCSAACKIEPFTDCKGAPSVCTSTIACPDGVVEPGEICDPPGTDGCLPGCKSFAPDVGAAATCGNSIIEAGEQCDKPQPGLGCTAGCVVEDGFSCPRPNVCFALPKCGDGVLNATLGEECDDGDADPSDGCDNCQVVPPFSCYGIQPSVCIQEVCGDGVRTPSEACDDGANGVGCTNCQVDAGWICPVEGQKCVERCGDGLKVGSEECDDKNTVNGDGCNSSCRIEPFFACPTVGAACKPTVCGNNLVEAGETCDKGDVIGGDGCGPTCQEEPTITPGPNPTVTLKGCGDGLITGNEVCDDGNTVDGDGCSADCKTVEPEWTCSDFVKLPLSVQIQVTYRDFKQRGSSGGHTDFEHDPYGSDRDVPGPVCKNNSTECTALPGVTCPAGTCGHLDAEGKPAFHLANGKGTITSPERFSLWYRDTNQNSVVGDNGVIGVQPIVSSLQLDQQGATTSDVYQFNSNNFFPLNGLGFGNDGNGQNFHFTTELRYFFQYKGGETLTFTGDDDVWVFVNGRHAVDIGGVHGARSGRVILGDDGGAGATDSDCSVHGGGLGACALEANEIASNDDTRFGLTKGGIYEIVLFQAERHTTQSNFQLTLAGFLPPRTYCTPKCGDGKVVGAEVCDDGKANNVDGVSGKCNTTCTARAFCGDGAVQTGEVCDNGTNLDLYWDGKTNGKCAPGCKTPSKCGDAKVEPAFEDCDNGASNSDASYGPGSCTAKCLLGGYCGDGTKNGTEKCDAGAMNGLTYGAGSCGYDCKPGPYCGDKIRNGGEECDGSANCNANCKLDPYCGDGVVSVGEDCDNGQFASPDYGGCTNQCKWAPYCGDATKNAPYEECDLGTQLNDGSYGGCTIECTQGPHCGDAIKQGDQGEACDNGFNEDDYAYTADSCGKNCTSVPYCGDGKVQAGNELCDAGADNSDSAYNGCTTKCDWGPYCGDGVQDASEKCDKGAANTAYSATGKACGYDCQTAPYCGDGERNGPEECDLGAAKNTGEYGGCTTDCNRSPYCGDRKIQNDQGEECDDGLAGSLGCSALCKRRGVK